MVQVQDLAIERVTVTNSDERDSYDRAHMENLYIPDILPKQKTRSLLRVDLTSKADLTYMLWDWDMFSGAHAVFCNHPDDNVLLGTSLYANRTGELPRSLGRPFPRPRNAPQRIVERADPADKQTYHFFPNIAVPANPDSIPPEVGFDLLHNPEDICISLRGSELVMLFPPRHRLRSNTTRLSSETT